jgi:hypothetical protein
MKRDSSVLVQMGLGERVHDVVDVAGGEAGRGGGCNIRHVQVDDFEVTAETDL